MLKQFNRELFVLIAIGMVAVLVVVIGGGIFTYRPPYTNTKTEVKNPSVKILPEESLNPEIKKEGIRGIDLYKFADQSGIVIRSEFGQAIDTPQYADLDGDGEEEAIFSVFSGGTSGSFGPFVAKLKNNSAVRLKIDPAPSLPEEVGLDWGHTFYLVKNHRLLVYFPLYKKGDPNCCPTAGSRYILYKWDNNFSKFVVDKAINLKSGPPDTTSDESLKEAMTVLGL